MGEKTTRYLEKPVNDRDRRRAKRKQERQCRDIRRRIGGCVFMLGVPLLLAGGIILIVSNVNNQSDVPPSLFILGPLLTCLSVVCFISGLLLTELINITPLLHCCVPDNPQTCPFFVKKTRSKNQRFIDQQTAAIASQDAPHKSALRKPPNPDVVPVASSNTRRGVRFSGSDDSTLLTNSSTESDTSDQRLEKHNERTSSQLSLVSLRHCKIHPKEIEEPTMVYTVSLNAFQAQDNVFEESDNIV